MAADTELHVRTFPSVLRDLEKSEVLPSVTYKRKVSAIGTKNELLRYWIIHP